MPLLVTPAQLTRRSDLFHQLGQMSAAGLGFIAAVQILQRNPPQASMRAPLGRALAMLQDGYGITESFTRAGAELSTFDLALIEAGEKSGRLPECFQLLSQYYNDRADLVRKVIGFTIYPIFIFHFAVLIFPVSTFTDLILKGQVLGFVAQKFFILAPLYLMALTIYFAMQTTHGELWRSMVERILGAVPILGPARQSLAVSRLSIALESLLNAGVTVIEAWELAAAASGSPALRRVVADAKPHWEAGVPPGDTVAERPEFPPAFASLYKSGELSGRLDDALRRSHTLFHEEGSRKLKRFVFGTAGLLVGLVFAMAAFQIISFWAGYFQQINNAVNFNQ